MALHGSQHFLIVAVLRSEKVWANKQEDDVIILVMLANLGMQFLAGSNTAILPRFNNTLTLEHCQLANDLSAIMPLMSYN